MEVKEEEYCELLHDEFCGFQLGGGVYPRRLSHIGMCC